MALDAVEQLALRYYIDLPELKVQQVINNQVHPPLNHRAATLHQCQYRSQ